MTFIFVANQREPYARSYYSSNDEVKFEEGTIEFKFSTFS